MDKGPTLKIVAVLGKGQSLHSGSETSSWRVTKGCGLAMPQEEQGHPGFPWTDVTCDCRKMGGVGWLMSLETVVHTCQVGCPGTQHISHFSLISAIPAAICLL